MGLLITPSIASCGQLGYRREEALAEGATEECDFWKAVEAALKPRQESH